MKFFTNELESTSNETEMDSDGLLEKDSATQWELSPETVLLNCL